MRKIWIAMSGGVDSSGAALLAMAQAERAAGVTLAMLGTDADRQNGADAAQVCERLGLGVGGEAAPGRGCHGVSGDLVVTQVYFRSFLRRGRSRNWLQGLMS